MLGKNNDEHQDHIIDIEKQSQALEQYTCRSNLEISAIPNNISYEALETKCIEILEVVAWCPPPLGSVCHRCQNDLCVISQAGGQLLIFKSQGGDTFRGGKMILGSEAGGGCFIMTNCWYFHKMLHLECYLIFFYLIFF